MLLHHSHSTTLTRNRPPSPNQVETAGSQLSTVTDKLNSVETILTEAIDGDGAADDVAVMTLLESMTEVKLEYQNLRKDLREVQQLQREMTTSLICQRQKMVQTFRILKHKIEVRKALKQH